MDPLPAQPASHDHDIDEGIRQTWLELVTAGATVPLTPGDLTLRHLAQASADGIDVRGR
nr:hypothetical protein GCM10025730_06180 [Promicromonospora thailandica]